MNKIFHATLTNTAVEHVYRTWNNNFYAIMHLLGYHDYDMYNLLFVLSLIFVMKFFIRYFFLKVNGNKKSQDVLWLLIFLVELTGIEPVAL